jgi:hypothetical protein
MGTGRTMTKTKLKVGDWVWFSIPGARIFGTIERFNRKTASVFRKFSSGYSRRKSFEKLRMWDWAIDKLVPVDETELKSIQSILEVQPRQYKKKKK